MRRSRPAAGVLGAIGFSSCVALASCGSGGTHASARTHRPPPVRSAAAPVVPATTTAPSTTPGRATTTTATPAGFVGTISTVTAADLPSTYRAGCPVGPSDLRMLHMSYWGFDAQPHTGTMVANAAVASAVLGVFGQLYAGHFPIREMVPEDAFGGSDPASMAADNTSGFNCRYAVAPGPPQWSVHASGEAIDVNPVENPYFEGGQWQPPAGAAYAARSDLRPGMAVPGGALVAAFASAGWQWGGRWSANPDYQHFSATGG